MHKVEEETETPHIIQRWISFGDIVTLIASLVVFAFGYGQLSQDVDRLADDVAMLNARDITPGAQTELAAIREKDASQDQQIADLRAELRESRREILESINRLGVDLKNHDKR